MYQACAEPASGTEGERTCESQPPAFECIEQPRSREADRERDDVVIAAQELRLTQVQLAHFTPELRFATAPLLRSLLAALGDTLDGELTAVPLPDGVPGNIPRLVLQSRDASLKLQMSFERADVFVTIKEREAFVGARDRAVQVLERVEEVLRSRIARLAMVCHWQLTAPDATERLLSHFQPGPSVGHLLADAVAFEWHLLRKGRFEVGVDANLWFRAKARAPEDGGPVVDVEQDINSLASLAAELAFGPADRLLFWRGATTTLTQQLGALFRAEEA